MDVLLRSVGRGLSNLMARIHEQEECKGGMLESPRDPLPRGVGSRWGGVGVRVVFAVVSHCFSKAITLQQLSLGVQMSHAQIFG